MSTQNELTKIVNQFAASGWDLIDAPAKAWLANNNRETTAELKKVIMQADKECGSCGCEMDALYKKALEALNA